jgi:hypothetical protein
MPHHHQVPGFAEDGPGHPGGGIFRLQPARRAKCGKGITAAPERFRRLFRAQLAAVPDDGRLHAAFGGPLRQRVDFDAATCREWPRRVDVRSNGVAVVNQIEQSYFDTIFKAVASIDFTPFSSLTSPVSVTVCDMCGTSFALLSAARSPVTL